MNDIKNLIKMLLEHATKHGADLHICPNSAPLLRLGSKKDVLQPVINFETSVLDLATAKTLIGELLTPEQKAELQKNKFLDFSLTYGELGRFRAYAYTQRGTHAITIHTLPFKVPDFLDLDFSAEAACKTEHITVDDEKGLIIVAGDYFSNKTATLAMLVDLMNIRGKYHISTIEKPIEYLHRHNNSIVVQKEIGADVPDFGTAIRQIRHEAPDIVMLSELRQEDFLSVMELAEERLVFAGLKINPLQDGGAFEVLKAIHDITRIEAARNNLIEAFIPRPNISVIFQQPREDYMYGELISWDMYDSEDINDSEDTPITPIMFGGRFSDEDEGN